MEMENACTFPLKIIDRNRPGIKRDIPIISSAPGRRKGEMTLSRSNARLSTAARTPIEAPTVIGQFLRTFDTIGMLICSFNNEC
jgi:hypothetical protein